MVASERATRTVRYEGRMGECVNVNVCGNERGYVQNACACTRNGAQDADADAGQTNGGERGAPILRKKGRMSAPGDNDSVVSKRA